MRIASCGPTCHHLSSGGRDRLPMYPMPATCRRSFCIYAARVAGTLSGPARGQAPATDGDGPPPGLSADDLDPDFFQMPYGLLSLAAQALRAGHQVKVFNLAAYPWPEAERGHRAARRRRCSACLLHRQSPRRGPGRPAPCVRHHPRPTSWWADPTPAPCPPSCSTTILTSTRWWSARERLTFLEDSARGSTDGAGLTGSRRHRVPGRHTSCARPGAGAIAGPGRPRLPHRLLRHPLAADRPGLPGTLHLLREERRLGAPVPHPVGGVCPRLPRAALDAAAGRDAARQGRHLHRQPQARLGHLPGDPRAGLDFLWSCDTRADAIDEELLRAMRLAGCQRLSFGVESGSATVLRNIQKKVTPDDIFQATRAGQAARPAGALLHDARQPRRDGRDLPREPGLRRAGPAAPGLFACLSVYPGHRDFHDLEQAGALDREEYFDGDFQELKTPYDASAEDTQLMSEWFEEQRRTARALPTRSDDYRAILGAARRSSCRPPGSGGRLLPRAASSTEAERHAARAVELGLPAPGLAHNLLACVAAERGDWQDAVRRLAAARCDPQHRVVAQNAARCRAGSSAAGRLRALPALTRRSTSSCSSARSSPCCLVRCPTTSPAGPLGSNRPAGRPRRLWGAAFALGLRHAAALRIAPWLVALAPCGPGLVSYPESEPPPEPL